jgi:DNA-binding response OmpR family regulator
MEADASLRRLILLSLQLRGMYVIEAHSSSDLLLGETIRPDLLVLDVDGSVKSDWPLLAAVQAHPLLSTLPTIILMWDCPVPALVSEVTQTQNSSQAQVMYLAKPFDARALYATIEQLLLPQPPPAVEAAQPPVPALQTASSAPSIYPLITAAGLLLAFIGLMGFLALTFVGVVVVLVSLLAWTLSTGSQQEQRPIPAGMSN